MKILYITNLTVPYRMKFFNELSKKCDLTVIFERENASNRNDEWLKSVGSQNFKSINLNAKKIGEENSFSPRIIKFLKEKYDFIIIGGYSTFTSMLAILYLRIRNISFIINADGGFINYEENKLNYYIKRFFISSANYWITTSNEALNYLDYYGAKKEKIYIYPFSSISKKCISNVTKKEKLKLKKELYINENEKMILSVGQIIPRKGFDILIQACMKLDEKYSLFIIGGKPTNDLLEMIDNAHQSKIHFIEFLDEENLMKYYKAADLFILPARFDVWGLVINEAIAYGLPIISSNKVGSAIEIFRNYNDVLFENENVLELKNKIEMLFKDDNLLSEFKRYSNKVVNKYTIENMAQEHISIFEGILREEDE